jgi:L-fucose mutarotase
VQLGFARQKPRRKMLKGLNPLLTPDVLSALCAMGHGDEVVIVDAHYPADVAARSSVYGKLLRMGGVAVPQAVRAVLSVLILDTLFDRPAERMEVDGMPDEVPAVQREAQIEVDRAAGRAQMFAAVPRQIFYVRAKKAYCVVITGESRRWGCFIFRKGVD